MTEPTAALYGEGIYGLNLYGYAYGDDLKSALHARCISYTEVELTWEYAAGTWTQMRIVRNQDGYPRDENDGETLDIDVLDFTYADTDVVAGRRYYYSAFLFLPTTYEWVRSGDADVLVPRNYGYHDLLWARLPAYYKNDTLYDFLGIFAFELDLIRTDYDALLDLPVPNAVSTRAVPAMLGMFGFTDEPEFSNLVSRRLIANATHLYGTKGTSAALENLATILTGWDSVVYVGYNRMLDNTDTLTEHTVGRWDTALVNCTIETRAEEAYAPPYGEAYTVLTADFAGYISASTADTSTARLHGVPVIAGIRYVASAYMRGAINARLIIDWYDQAGQLLDSSFGVTLPGASDWTTQFTADGTAPDTAATAAVRIFAEAVTPGQEIWAHAVQFEEASSPRAFQQARQVFFVMRADLVNEIDNPTGTAGVQGWVTNSALSSSADGFVYTWGA